MARRLTLEGAKVLAVVELMPYSNGLNRNIVQCLNDYNIPLYLSHTVSNIIAKNNRVEKVVVSKVDDKGNILKGDEMIFECDTLLLSVGLIPENELSKSAHIDIDKRTSGPIVSQNYQTSIGGIFACGNVLHVHDLVDFVSLEGARVGKNVAKYLKNEIKEDVNINIVNKNMVSYTIPQHITSLDDDINIFFRVRKPMQNKNIVVRDDHDQIIFSVRKLFLAPGEMENIIVKKDKIGQDVKEISVQVEDL
jgi:alkyl hydroperoxide reductase subunit AhpF